MLFNLSNKVIFFGSAFLIAFPVEVLFRFVATDNPKAFVAALIFYPIFLVIMLVMGKIILGSIGRLSKISGYGSYYLFSGLLGLLVFEWFISGNSPWGNPNANQFTMFSYWAFLAFIPKILSERENDSIKPADKIKKVMIIHLIGYFAISFIGGLMMPEGYPRFEWVIWTAIVAFSLMNIHVILFLWKIRSV